MAVGGFDHYNQRATRPVLASSSSSIPPNDDGASWGPKWRLALRF